MISVTAQYKFRTLLWSPWREALEGVFLYGSEDFSLSVSSSPSPVREGRERCPACFSAVVSARPSEGL